MRQFPISARPSQRLVALLLASLCSPAIADEPSQPDKHSDGSIASVQLAVHLDLAEKIYQQTRYKNPPQFAVWIENRATGEMRTLYVTQKLGRGTWNGKPVVPISLPYWVSRHNRQTNTKGDPTRESPLPDAITQPTPTNEFHIDCAVPPGSIWHCFVEVNVSGDYNDAFPQKQVDDREDKFGNGQPSIVYRATINTSGGQQASFKLIGRTSQLEASSKLHADTSGITTAEQLFTELRVSCQ